jgi:hypothetical protein
MWFARCTVRPTDSQRKRLTSVMGVVAILTLFCHAAAALGHPAGPGHVKRSKVARRSVHSHSSPDYQGLKTAARDSELRAYYRAVPMCQGVFVHNLVVGREQARVVEVATGSGVAITRVFLYLVSSGKRQLAWEGSIPMDWYPWQVVGTSNTIEIVPKRDVLRKRAPTPPGQYSLKIAPLKRSLKVPPSKNR